MRSDFRQEFYSKYNSTFKVHISDFSQKSIAKMWKKNDFLYLPLISSYEPGAPVLELGCGRGYMLEYLRNKGFNNLKGIDISEEQINISRQKGFDVEVADVNDYLNRNTIKFKIIIALDFVEHFSKDDLIPLFEKIYNKLEANGIFIFHTPNGQSLLSTNLIYGDLTHLTIFTPNSALQLLKLVGFDQIAFYESGPVPRNILGLFRLIVWKIIRLGYNFASLVETGNKHEILTQSFIVAARK
ncbi:MAG: class I SAM-dependent methyltransferase [Ignavibacteriaceae bacterium]|nr:class I SAM-dependent methyltransferase [Ignavibacteriaceae bacterium]